MPGCADLSADDRLCDGTRATLELGRDAVISAVLGDRVRLIGRGLPCLPFGDRQFDACSSNGLLHRPRRPEAPWSETRRFGRHGASLFVMDLYRPAGRREVRELVERAAGDQGSALKQDFSNSRFATFTVEEVRAPLDAAGRGNRPCAIVSERHWLAAGRMR